MTDFTRLYQGISRCAWAYFFLYFDINFGTVTILPDFVAFWLFSSGIALMVEEERELELLIPLSDLLMVYHGLQWVLNLFGWDLAGVIPGLSIVVCLANLYFHFQLLTNLASLAAKHQPEGTEHDRKLLGYRTMQTILFTLTMVFTYVGEFGGDFWKYLSIALAGVYLIAGVCMMAALFGLRKVFLASAES